MGSEEFDEVTRSAGREVSRRRMLKVVVLGAFAAVLAKVGLDRLEHTSTNVVKVDTGTTLPDGQLLPDGPVIDVASLSPASALPTAQRIAQGAQAMVQFTIGQSSPPSQACAALLAAEARLIATFDALIRAFPQLAPELRRTLNAALAAINAALARLGCPGISASGTTTTTRPRPTTTTTRPRPTTTTTRPRPTTTTTRPRPTTTTTVPHGICCQIYVFGVPTCCCSDSCTPGRRRECTTSTFFFRCAPTFFSCSFATAVSSGCFRGTCNTNTGRCPGA